MKHALFFFSILLLSLVGGCNEDRWLEEVPLDFYSPINSYSTEADFNSAVATLYANVHETLYDVNSMNGRAMHYPTNLARSTIELTHALTLYSSKKLPPQ